MLNFKVSNMATFWQAAYLLLMFIAMSIGYGPFPVKYIGDYLTENEYKNLTICGSKICLADAEILIDHASHDKIDPCKDSYNFSCGNFNKERALNERYEFIGFLKNVDLSKNEKRHRVLKQLVEENDLKAVKIIKNFYRKCTDWREFIKT